MTHTFLTCSHPVCPINTAFLQVISTIIELPTFIKITGRILIRVCPNPGQVTSPLWSSPHTHTAPATRIRLIHTKPGPSSSCHLHLRLTHKDQKCARNCKPSSTHIRWIGSWKCSLSWWMLKRWLQRSLNWKLSAWYSDYFSVSFNLEITRVWVKSLCHCEQKMTGEDFKPPVTRGEFKTNQVKCAILFINSLAGQCWVICMTLKSSVIMSSIFWMKRPLDRRWLRF